MAALKYHPDERNGSMFITAPDVVGVSAWIQFQSPSLSSVRFLTLSKQQHKLQSEDVYFQQLARQRTTSTDQVSPRPGEPC